MSVVGRRMLGGKSGDPNTVLLLHAEDFTDSSMYKRPIAHSNVSISSTAKFGKSFRYYWEPNYSVVARNLPISFLPSEQFTMECWVNYTIGPNTHTIFTVETNSGLHLRIRNDNPNSQPQFVELVAANNIIIATGSIGVYQKTWCHIALVCTGNYRAKTYINGVKDLDVNCSVLRGSGTLAVGCHIINNDVNEAFNGYIDEVRISNVARYTSNFTPPDKPFKS